jgi:hypothetical protein
MLLSGVPTACSSSQPAPPPQLSKRSMLSPTFREAPPPLVPRGRRKAEAHPSTRAQHRPSPPRFEDGEWTLRRKVVPPGPQRDALPQRPQWGTCGWGLWTRDGAPSQRQHCVVQRAGWSPRCPPPEWGPGMPCGHCCARFPHLSRARVDSCTRHTPWAVGVGMHSAQTIASTNQINANHGEWETKGGGGVQAEG